MADTETKVAATGRRKESVARVRVTAGTGQFDLNGRTLEEYFPSRTQRMLATAPLRAAGKEKEVDVVARQGATTVFVEVKERHGASHGEGHEGVTFGKRRRLTRAARLYAAARGLMESPLRFDVVSIDWREGRPHIRHDVDAFTAEG